MSRSVWRPRRPALYSPTIWKGRPREPPGFTVKLFGGVYYAVLACPFKSPSRALSFAVYACRSQNLQGFVHAVEQALDVLQATDPSGSSEIDHVMRRLEDLRDRALVDLAGWRQHFTESQLATLGSTGPSHN